MTPVETTIFSFLISVSFLQFLLLLSPTCYFRLQSQTVLTFTHSDLPVTLGSQSQIDLLVTLGSTVRTLTDSDLHVTIGSSVLDSSYIYSLRPACYFGFSNLRHSLFLLTQARILVTLGSIVLTFNQSDLLVTLFYSSYIGSLRLTYLLLQVLQFIL